MLRASHTVGFAGFRRGGFHVFVGSTCVATGAVAMLSRKRRGRRSDFGTGFGRGLRLVYRLAIVRWAEDYRGLLESAIDRSQTTVREEAQELLARSIQHLKDRHGRPGLENEEIAARAAKLLPKRRPARRKPPRPRPKRERSNCGRWRGSFAWSSKPSGPSWHRGARRIPRRAGRSGAVLGA